MKAGRASKTAEIVCIGRAIADRDPATPSFHDPTAFALLPESGRERVEQVRSGIPPKGLRQTFIHNYHVRQAKVMVARTIAIDDAVREAGAPQVVILGAGLDGRAWRMRDLSNAVVFEVDHPDSQRDKRGRVASLEQTAREVRFVPVDFTKDDLESALTKAGHDSTRPTTWIWEGVVMYLERRDIEATLDVIARRSTPSSRVIVLYHSPALIVWIVGSVVRRLGEPLRSSFTEDQMRELLAGHGFGVVSDRSLPEIGRTISPEVAEATKVTKHLRLVTAARR
jgi:methyltransferase (TIGR00027 family)